MKPVPTGARPLGEPMYGFAFLGESEFGLLGFESEFGCPVSKDTQFPEFGCLGESAFGFLVSRSWPFVFQRGSDKGDF